MNGVRWDISRTCLVSRKMQSAVKRCCRRAFASSPLLRKPLAPTHRSSGIVITPQACASSTSRLHSSALSSGTQPRLRSAPKLPTMAPHRTSATQNPAGAHATKRVLVPIANGTEEIEAVVIIDVLRRAGAEVVVASVENDLQVTCARGTKIVADEGITTAALQSYDHIALPGGMPGAERLRDCLALENLLHTQRSNNKPYAAICASPTVFLQAKGLIGPNTKATAHPAFSGQLKDQSAVNERVVEDGLVTTSRGPGTAFEFSLALVKQLFGEQKMKEVAAPMVMHTY